MGGMPNQPYPSMPSGHHQGQNTALAAGAGALASSLLSGHKGHGGHGKNAAMAAGAAALAGTVFGKSGHGGSSGGMASLASQGLAAYLTDKQRKKAMKHAGKQGLNVDQYLDYNLEQRSECSRLYGSSANQKGH